MGNALITALAALFVFGLMIIGHELGHFVVAKLSGVGVLEFSFGMGPKLFSFKPKEVEYSVRILPIGGYVQMLGAEDDSDDPRAFCNKSPLKRLLIMIAGPLMNFVMAVALFFFYSMNIGIPTTIINNVDIGYPAQQLGVVTGDKIIEANDTKITDPYQLNQIIIDNKENPIKLTVMRKGEKKTFNLLPKYDNENQKYRIGISYKVLTGNFGASIKDAMYKTASSIKEMVVFLGGAFKGKLTINDLGGPVAVVKMSGQVAQAGIWYLCFFAGFLSINLGIMNLIPFPGLDGGWVIILLIEAIRGKKIDDKKIGIINFIGFSMLMVLVVIVTYKDIFIR